MKLSKKQRQEIATVTISGIAAGTVVAIVQTVLDIFKPYLERFINSLFS